jgi:hypothetical protein
MINHGDGLNTPYLFARFDAAAAADAQVIVSLIERVVAIYR